MSEAIGKYPRSSFDRSAKPVDEAGERLITTVLRPLTHTGNTYRIVVLVLFAVVCWGAYAYSVQLRKGLIVTDMRDHIVWGLYIANFVFFIGISHAGTLISAILRVTHAEWRTPITRMAEFITVVALSVGALFPLIDLARPDRVANIIVYGRWQSPIVWDILAISTYLTGSLIYLYLPMIPDLAMVRDRLSASMSPLKRGFYRLLSIGWRGTSAQERYSSRGIGIMAVLIIPIAISVHTVVSFIFAMNLRTGWDSTVFGIYFVGGAIFSGLATLILVMAILRRAFHLGEYLTDKQFLYLGYMLGTFAGIMVYFNALELLVPGFKMEGSELFLFRERFIGEYATLYWMYLVGGLMIPGLIILIPRTRTFWGIIAAAILVNIGMWLERFLIVVPVLRVPLMAHEPASYSPTWVEWSIMAGAFAAFGLLIAVFAKIFPVLSIWEIKEQLVSEQSNIVEEV